MTSPDRSRPRAILCGMLLQLWARLEDLLFTVPAVRLPRPFDDGTALAAATISVLALVARTVGVLVLDRAHMTSVVLCGVLVRLWARLEDPLFTVPPVRFPRPLADDGVNFAVVTLSETAPVRPRVGVPERLEARESARGCGFEPGGLSASVSSVTAPSIGQREIQNKIKIKNKQKRMGEKDGI